MNIFERLKTTLTRLDIVGERLSFEHKEEQRFKSFIGGLISLFTIIVIIVLGLLFSKEFFERKSPSVTSSQELIKESKVNIEDLILFLTFNTPDGKKVEDPLSYISFSLARVDIYSNNTNNFLEPQNYTIGECNMAKLKKSKYSYLIADFDPSNIVYFCIENYENLNFKNGFTELDSSFIDIRVDKCNNKVRKCADDMDKVLENCYVAARFLNSYVDFNNYTDPIQYLMSVHTQKLSYSLKTESYLRFTKNALKSYEGLLLDDYNQLNYTSLESKSTEKFFGEGPFYFLRFESPKIRAFSIRKYLTIQDVFAKIGGFANAIFIVVYIISYHYLRYKYYFHIKSLLENEFDFAEINVSSKYLKKIMVSNSKYSQSPDANLIQKVGKNRGDFRFKSLKEKYKASLKDVNLKKGERKSKHKEKKQAFSSVVNKLNENERREENLKTDQIINPIKSNRSNMKRHSLTKEDTHFEPNFINFLCNKYFKKNVEHKNTYREIINLVDVTLSFKNLLKHIHYINVN